MPPRQLSVLALFVVTACGSKEKIPHDPTTTQPTDQPIVMAGGLTPELIAAVGERKLLVQPLFSLRLSAAERLRAQQLIAQWASETGLQILPPDQVESAIERAAAGQDPTGQACGPALDREVAIERWVMDMGAQGSITPRVDCGASCTLALEIRLFNMGTEFFAAPFDPSKPWDHELVRRLPTVVDVGGKNRYGHANNPVKSEGVPRESGAADWYLEDNATVDGKEAGAGVACGATDRSVVVMIDRAADGALTCEAAGLQNYMTEYDPRINACVCAVAVKTEQPTTPRSYVVYPGLPTPERPTTKDGKTISAMLIGGNEYRPGGTARWMLRESDSIAHCFVDRTAVTGPSEIAASLEFDGSGRVAKAMIGDLTGMLQPAEHACVMTKLRAITSPCPTATPLPGHVRVTLEIRGP